MSIPPFNSSSLGSNAAMPDKAAMDNANSLLRGPLRQVARLRTTMLVARVITYAGALAWMLWCMSRIFVASYGVFGADDAMGYGVMGGVGVVVTVGVASFAYVRLNSRLSMREEEIMTDIVHRLYPEASYSPEGKVDVKEVARSGIFTAQHEGERSLVVGCYGQLSFGGENTSNIETGEDIARGTTGESSLLVQDLGVSVWRPQQMGPAEVMRVVWYTWLAPIFSRSTTPLHGFRGLFGTGRLPRSMRGFVLLLPDHLEDRVGHWAYHLQAMRQRDDAKLVVMEDPEFESLFEVWAADEVEARMLLTPAMMRRLTAVRRAFPRDLSMSFHGNRFYYAASTPDGFLRPGRRGVHNDQLLQQLALEIQFCREVEELIR